MTSPAGRTPADLVVTGAKVWTADPDRPWATSLAVAGGVLLAVGSEADTADLVGPATEVVDLDGALVVPGLVDVHLHLNLGGGQAAWELPLTPDLDVDGVLAAVRAWAGELGPTDWVVGGIVGSTTLSRVATPEALARLDEAAGGRPVLLRDDTMHNRWVNTAALRAMGVGDDSEDPEGGHYVRDDTGRPTGVLHEMASAAAEAAFAASVPDPAARTLGSMAKALEVVNSYGITTVQDAASTTAPVAALAELERAGRLSARVVTSAPVRPFLEASTVGDELLAELAPHASELVRNDFVKIVLDGVPMTRTTALLSPYLCRHDHTAAGSGGEEGEERGELYWTPEDLRAQLAHCHDLGLGAKCHATGDAAVRAVLDAVESVRAEKGPGPIVHVAHAEYVHPDDLPRFAQLGVVADASPGIWYPGVIQDAIAEHVPAAVVDESWPLKDLLASGAVVAAGSDWPCALPTPDPWTGLEALVTRRNPDPAVPGALNPEQGLTLEQALGAYTTGPAAALGLADRVGRLRAGLAADFVALDQDVFAVPVEQVHRTRATRTWFGGRLVHSADPVVPAA